MRSIPTLTLFSKARRLLLGVGLGLLVAVLLAVLRGAELLESLELRLVDVRTRHFAPQRETDDRIVLMQIEESDVEDVRRDLGQPWPWPLETNAHMVRVLQEAGAAVLVVDVLHLDRGAGPDDVPAGTELPTAARRKREIEAKDADVYGKALAAFGEAVLGFELTMSTKYEVQARRAAALPRLGTDALPVGLDAFARPGASLPVRRVAAGAAQLGFTNAPPDLDGVVRHAAVVGRWGEHGVMSLPLAAASRFAGGARLAAGTARTTGFTGGARRTGEVVHVGERAQALMPGGRFLVNHGAGRYARVAPAQVLAWAIERETAGKLPGAARTALEGRIVVLGVNLPGLKDVVASPLGGTMDGPAFQATVLDNLLHGDGRVRASRGANVLLLLGLAALAGLLGALVRGRWLPHLVPLGLGSLLVAGAYARFGAGVSIDLVTPLLALLLVWGGTFALRSLTEGRRNRWLEGAFGRYMSPALLAALQRDPSLLALGGRTRHVSILFSDVAGFTRLSENLAAEDVVRLLNRYLTDHCAAVMDEGGVVDKFEGDAVMAFYGDPVEQPDHALRACRTALRVQRELPRLRPLLDELGLADFDVRIGVNSGEAVVGNMGSDQRFDYTCIGDTVNLASRIEGAGKAFGTHLLVGGDTAQAVGDAMLFKPLGALVVVGREEPVEVCELLAERREADAELLAHVEAFARAVAAARAGKLDEARTALDEAGRLRPDDGPTAWLRATLAELGSGPWTGVTVLDRK